MGRWVPSFSLACTPSLVATRRSRQSLKYCSTRFAALPPGMTVVWVRLPSPTPPASETLAVTWTMFEGGVLLVGDHDPEPGVSLVPTQVLTIRDSPSNTVRSIVPVSDCTRFLRP